MCGIAGIVGRADATAVGSMMRIQSHRGPDDAGLIILEQHRVSLGHRRLSIIDLSPGGSQPMANNDRNIWITFNGEIYNYKEISRDLSARGYRFRSQSDTEVLLASYEEWGLACLDRLNGMFAFAIYDARYGRLFAARDRLGIKPFYYYYKHGLLVFASEIKALFLCPGVPKRPDFAALATPARFQVSPYTGFEGIHKLPPGHRLVYEAGRFEIQPYWGITVSDSRDEGDQQTTQKLDALLNDAVRLQLVADVPVGVFLSGGLDSSLVSALVRKHTSKDVHAFTIRFSEADQRFEQMPDDGYYARKMAERFHFRYEEFEIRPDIETLLPKLIWHLDEPLSDPAAINTYLISRAARERNIVVLLNGMGGDEIFGGYRKHLACVWAGLYQKLTPRPMRAIAESMLSRFHVATATRGLRGLRWAKRLASFASLNEFDRYLASDMSLSREQYHRLFGNRFNYQSSYYYQAQKDVFESPSASYLTRMCLNDTKFFLAEHNLLYSDKATMAASIESRPPLTDHRLVEFMFSLPPRYRIRRNEQKFLLKKVAESYLPRDIVYRPKAPFGSPLRAWIRGPLAQMVDDLLLSPGAKSAELYEPKYVKELIAQDRQGREDNALLIWTLLTNELWLRTNFEHQSSERISPVAI